MKTVMFDCFRFRLVIFCLYYGVKADIKAKEQTTCLCGLFSCLYWINWIEERGTREGASSLVYHMFPHIQCIGLHLYTLTPIMFLVDNIHSMTSRTCSSHSNIFRTRQHDTIHARNVSIILFVFNTMHLSNFEYFRDWRVREINLH